MRPLQNFRHPIPLQSTKLASAPQEKDEIGWFVLNRSVRSRTLRLCLLKKSGMHPVSRTPRWCTCYERRSSANCCRSHYVGQGPFSGRESPLSSNVWSWDVSRIRTAVKERGCKTGRRLRSTVTGPFATFAHLVRVTINQFLSDPFEAVQRGTRRIDLPCE